MFFEVMSISPDVFSLKEDDIEPEVDQEEHAIADAKRAFMRQESVYFLEASLRCVTFHAFQRFYSLLTNTHIIVNNYFACRQHSRKTLSPEVHGPICKYVPLKKQLEEDLKNDKLIQAEKAATGNVGSFCDSKLELR